MPRDHRSHLHFKTLIEFTEIILSLIHFLHHTEFLRKQATQIYFIAVEQLTRVV
jgi:hypothetical protein